MSGSGSSYLELLENQIVQFRTSHTPGPLSIAFFFLGFILINYSIRMLFPSEPEDRQLGMSGLSHESKIDEQDPKEQEEGEEGEGTGSMMRMILLKNRFPSSHRLRISSNRFGSDSITSSLLPDPFSISSSIASPITSTDSHQNFIQHHLRASYPQAQPAQRFEDLSDSSSSSTTST